MLDHYLSSGQIAAHTPTTGTHGSALAQAGLVVIPVNGDKVATVPWKDYQLQAPAADQIATWFSGNDQQTAIITGRVNRLIVLDIDTNAQLNRLGLKYPELYETFSVKTRRGYHLYYLIPDDLYVPSRAGQGVDLKAEGGYVVAFGSQIDGHTYRPLTGFAIKTIGKREASCLLQFVGGRYAERMRIETLQESRQKLQATTEIIPQEPKKKERPQSLSPEELRGLYRVLEKDEGRNNGLFRAACRARDYGWTCADVEAALLELFVQSQKAKQEAHYKREREGRRTIRSAFTYPVREVHESEKGGLPNTIREGLMEHGMMAVLRTLEGLYLLGYEAGDVINRQIAVKALDGVVGRNTIDVALNTKFHSGERVFSIYIPPADAAVPKASERTSKCLEVGGKKGGRTSQPVVVPSAQRLSQGLGVAISRISDPLTLDDLRSGKAVRTRLHVAFIERRPGEYAVQYLANRLSVTKRTLRSYNRENPRIEGVKRVQSTPLHGGNLDSVLPKGDWLPHPGFWLEDGRGKKYPAKHAVAATLFKRGKRLTLVRQLTNYWRVAELEQADNPAGAGQMVENTAEKFMRNEIVIQVEVPPRSRPKAPKRSDPPHKKRNRRANPPKSQVKKGRPVTGKRKLNDPLDEACAETVQKRINAMTTNPTDKMSLRSARRLVAQYGRGRVIRAVDYMAGRRNPVNKPVGFLYTGVAEWVDNRKFMVL